MENLLLSVCSSVFRACTSADTVSTLHLLSVLKDVMPLLSAKTIGNLVTPSLQLLDLGDRTMFIHVLNTIESIASHESCEISEKTLASAVSVIISKQPMHQKGASEATKAYLSCLGAVLRKQYAAAPAAVEARLPEVFAAVSSYFLAADADDAAVAAANLMCDMIDLAVQPPLIQQALQATAICPRRDADASPLPLMKRFIEARLLPRRRRPTRDSPARRRRGGGRRPCPR
jgi:hypothetical protein